MIGLFFVRYQRNGHDDSFLGGGRLRLRLAGISAGLANTALQSNEVNDSSLGGGRP